MGPLLWYDFADPSVVTVSGGQISQVNDKGSRGWNLTKSTTGPQQSTWTNNSLNCCDWGTAGHSNYLRNTTSTSTDIAEVYVVMKANYGSTFPGYNALFSAPSSNLYITGWPGQTYFDSNPFNAAYVNNSASNTFATIVPAINSPCLVRINRTDSGTGNTTSGFQLGFDRIYTGRGWGGLIGEVVVFSTQLSSANRTKIQTFMARKWGLTLS